MPLGCAKGLIGTVVGKIAIDLLSTATDYTIIPLFWGITVVNFPAFLHRFAGIFGYWTLWRFKLKNSLEGWPAEISGLLSIRADSGNTIIFEEGVRLEGVSIRFGGSGNTLIFRERTNPKGRFIVNGGGTIEIGAGTRFNKVSWMQALGGKSIRVGKNCLLADIRIRTSDVHKIFDKKTSEQINPPKDVVIGDKVWIAESTVIYKGSNIGSGSIIGGHSVVTGEIPAQCLAVGVPAKVKKTGVRWKR